MPRSYSAESENDMTEKGNTYEGGCACGAIRYRMESKPLFVHCCHCHWCQRETGASYALNAMIEADRVTLLQGSPEMVQTPSNSGKGQTIWRCPDCRIALWSNYSGPGTRCISCVSEPLTRRTAYRQIYTYIQRPSSPGSSFLTDTLPSRGTTTGKSTGRKKVSRGGSEFSGCPAEITANHLARGR